MIETFFPYLLKASGILLLFWGAYNLFLSRETFYSYNRHFLLSGWLAAFILPLFPIPRYITISTQTVVPIETLGTMTAAAEPGMSVNPLWWLLLLYVIGLIACIGILLKQFVSLYRIYKNGEKIRDEGYTYIKLGQDVPPFSFFNMIFYSGHAFSDQDMESIIAHEKAHCKQWHTLDILLSKFTAIILWFNPIAWLYQKNIVQNLEFLADNAACHERPLKSYQYTLLKATSRHLAPALTNTFYNSLIKKRIVMLHQSRSKRTNLLKLGLILPALALFLWSFNTVDVYVPAKDEPIAATLTDGKSIDITINSETTNAELKEIKKDLKEKGIDFSYTAVRNEDGEIIDLEIQVNSDQDGKSVSGSSSFSNDGEPIDPVRIMISDDHGMQLFMGKEEDGNYTMIHEDVDKSVWVHDGDEKHKRIEIIKMGDGDNKTMKVIVDGEEVSEDVYNEMKGDDKVIKKTVKIRTDKDSKDKNVFIMKDSDDEHDIEVIEGDGSGFMFIDVDGDGDEPMFIIDGKESSRKEVEDLGAKNIETIEVLKGEAAEKKYGKKAKDGVVEITTKKKD